MKTNVGSTDKIIRMTSAVALSALYFTGAVGGPLGIALLAVGGILLATSLISFCPLYAIFGMNTCPRK